MPKSDEGKPRSDEVRPGEHRAARRALELIEHVANSQSPVSLSELSRSLDVPKSSVHALVRTLTAERYLEHSVEGLGYTLGPRLLRLIGRVRDVHVPRVARPVMQRLVGEIEETAILGVRQADAVIYVEQVEAAQFVRYAAPLGSTRPLHCTTVGKLFLAEMTDEYAGRLLSHLKLDAFTDQTKVDVASVLADLAEVRAKGYAVNREESIASVIAVAAPVYESTAMGRHLVAGLSLAGPSDRMADKLADATCRVVAAADEISADIAFD